MYQALKSLLNILASRSCTEESSVDRWPSTVDRC